MNGRSYFAAECRDCERLIVLQVPAEDSFIGANGLRGRCAECGRTEWCTKASQEKIQTA